MVVVIDEGRDGLLQFPGEVVVVKLDDVLHGAMPALDFALGLRMMNGSTDMGDLVVIEIVSQLV